MALPAYCALHTRRICIGVVTTQGFIWKSALGRKCGFLRISRTTSERLLWSSGRGVYGHGGNLCLRIPSSSLNAVCHIQQPRRCWMSVLSPVLIPSPETYCGFELNSCRYMYYRLVVFSPTSHASVLMSTRPFWPLFLPRRLTFVSCEAGRQGRGATFGSGHYWMDPNGHLNLQTHLFLPFFFLWVMV